MVGSQGTIITFFPWANAYQGKVGGGQVGVTTYIIPVGSVNFWKNRLTKFNITYNIAKRFGETYLEFSDPHGLQLELVERDEGEPNNWTHGDVTPEVAIKGFGGAILLSTNPEKTEETLLNVLGLKKVGEEDDLIRFKSHGDIGNVIDVKRTPIGRGQMGVGTVHHIAWRAKDNEDHLDWQQHVANSGYGVTAVRDRNYFNAVYFKEYGEILFEIATDPTGFTHDESYETMGTELKLPAQYEQYRDQLNRSLIPIEIRNVDN